jgi:hypothetical protein
MFVRTRTRSHFPEMSLGCFGLGSQRTNDLRILVGEQKTELESLQRENANLVTQIEAHKRAQADAVAASDKDVNGLHLRISELEIDLDRHKSSNSLLRSGRDSDHDAARLTEQIQARVAHFHDSRNQQHNELVFNKHANQATNLMTVDAMTAALLELGVQLTQDEAAAVFESVDTDENGGLDLQEFTKAINRPSKVQQWIETLPLAPLLAHCLSFKGGDSSDPLREVSGLSADELRASTQAYCESAQKVLADALRDLKKCYDAMDALAASSSANGNSKFQTPKMSAGSVEEFYKGLVGRVGECRFSGIECPRVLSLPALCRRPAP